MLRAIGDPGLGTEDPASAAVRRPAADRPLRLAGRHCPKACPEQSRRTRHFTKVITGTQPPASAAGPPAPRHGRSVWQCTSESTGVKPNTTCVFPMKRTHRIIGW